MLLNTLNITYVLEYYTKLGIIVNDTFNTKYLNTVSFTTEEALLSYISDLQKDTYFVGIKSIRYIKEFELV